MALHIYGQRSKICQCFAHHHSLVIIIFIQLEWYRLLQLWLLVLCLDDRHDVRMLHARLTFLHASVVALHKKCKLVRCTWYTWLRLCVQQLKRSLAVTAALQVSVNWLWVSANSAHKNIENLINEADIVLDFWHGTNKGFKTGSK